MERIRGLTEKEAEERLRTYGANEIIEREKVSAWKIFLRQFEEPIILIFIAAAVMSAFLGEMLDFGVITAITLFIVVLGFLQEYKAEEALEKLREISLPITRVIREGKLREIPVEQVVPGDVVFLQAGDMVPADCRILKAMEIAVDESMLTGESLPVEKKEGDMLYRGTVVVRGNAQAVVEATGMQTRFGKIAEMLAYETESSIKEKAEELAKAVTNLVLVASFLMLLVGLLKGASPVSIISAAIATAIAGIPEALPLTSTIVLAIGVYHMAKKSAIVRRMSAVEELGLVTVICTDKTGTLTKNQMTVEKIWNGEWYEVTGRGYALEGKVLKEGKETKDLDKLFLAAVLCNNADISLKDGEIEVVGDPLEAALLVAARKYGFNEDFLRARYPRISEEPFSSRKKYMSTTHEIDGRHVKFIKGAPEVVLEMCSHAFYRGKIARIEDVKKEIEKAEEEMAKEGLRVLAFASREGHSTIFLGLVGMEDPPREGVREAIALAREAGIRVIMITGDSAETARAIGKKIGIEGEVITGKELLEIDEEELKEKVKKVAIFARVNPEDKLKIVKLLRETGEIVAMTGDGVNDAPALKEADVGIAMGKRGTEVAKGAADIVLADDNFATIIRAIEMGRGIYENIRKFTAFLISWNIGITLLIVLSALLFSIDHLVLLPLQILLLNVVLEDMPAIALGLDPVDREVMKRPPRDPREPFISGGMWVMIGGIGIYIALISMAVFLIHAINLPLARTVTFLTFAMLVIFNTLNFRSLHESTFKTAFKPNHYLLLAFIGSLSLTLVSIYSPAGLHVFKFVPVSRDHWIFSALVAISIIPAGEIVKRSISKT